MALESVLTLFDVLALPGAETPPAADPSGAPATGVTGSGSAAPIWGMFALAALISLVALGLQVRRSADPVKAGIVRSAMALILVMALVVLAFASLYDTTDKDIRMLMFGAVVAMTSGVVAFYFSSRTADSARKDLLAATTGVPVVVPELTGLTVLQAKAKMSASHLWLALPATAADTSVVAGQDPSAGRMVPLVSQVTVTLAAPEPPKPPDA
ncbi:PASTA domain-containing protein [Kitasatospora sp. NPDC002040]|uniref:PASTA domain-containing protein n=1 Tax=Kitasatospora sp. NPDC002040 TaxID=3154661 RepID=UPI0033340D29